MREDPPIPPTPEVKNSFFRQALSKLNIGFSTGYGYTIYKQNLSGYSVFRQGETHFLVPKSSISYGRVNRSFTQWLNDPQDQSNVLPREDNVTVTGDTAQLGLFGSGQSLPLNFNLSVNLIDRFKLGGGVSAEIFSIRDLDFTGENEKLGSYLSDVNSAIMLRYYGSLAMRVSRWYFWDFSADLQVGKKNYLTQFNKAQLSDGYFYNLGFLVERHFSEYFRLTLRPSAEWSSYKMNLAGAEQSVTTQTPAFYLQAGISFNIPRLSRCPMSGCQTQLEHVHSGKEFRGQPIYRWQNPKYGQNHPELMRNKKRKKEDTEQRLQYKKKKKRKRFLFW